MLATIERQIPRMRPAEQLVGRYVLNNIEAVIQGTLASIAGASGVSEPTVLRFCRTCGFRSFSDFKIQLVRSVTAAEGQRNADKPVHIGPEDTVASAADKVYSAAINALS